MTFPVEALDRFSIVQSRVIPSTVAIRGKARGWEHTCHGGMKAECILVQNMNYAFHAVIRFMNKKKNDGL